MNVETNTFLYIDEVVKMCEKVVEKYAKDYTWVVMGRQLMVEVSDGDWVNSVGFLKAIKQELGTLPFNVTMTTSNVKSGIANIQISPLHNHYFLDNTHFKAIGKVNVLQKVDEDCVISKNSNITVKEKLEESMLKLGIEVDSNDIYMYKNDDYIVTSICMFVEPDTHKFAQCLFKNLMNVKSLYPIMKGFVGFRVIDDLIYYYFITRRV